MSGHLLRKIFPRKVRSDESGVALIFALTFLALLLTMLIGFLSSALLERKAMSNQTAHVGAKIAARSALRKVATTLKYYGTDINTMILYGDGGEGKTIMPFASHGPTGTGTVNDEDPVDHGGSKTPYDLLKDVFFVNNQGENGYFSEDAWFPDDPDHQTVRKAEWLPLRAGSDGRLTGRVAYLIFPNLGINPTIFSTADQEYTSKDTLKQEIYWKGTYSDTELTRKSTALTHLPFIGSATGDHTPAQVLTGTSPSLANWGTTDFMTAYFDTYGPGNSTYSVTGSTTGLGYSDFRSSSSAAHNRDFFNLYFMPYTATYAANHTAPGTRGGEETANRFNLYDFSFWEEQSNQVTVSNFNLLKHLQDFDSPQKEQILANLIDYCDTDSVPTSNKSATEWTGCSEHPTYTGNEKTPYLAQFAVRYQPAGSACYEVSSETVGYSTVYYVQIRFKCRVKVSPLAKLVNIYNTAYPESGTSALNVLVRNFSFKVTGTASVSSGENKSFTIQPDAAADFSIARSGASVAANAYYPLELTAPMEYTAEVEFAKFPIAGETPTADELQVQFDAQLEEQSLFSLVFSTNAGPVDYVYPNSGLCTASGFSKSLYCTTPPNDETSKKTATAGTAYSFEDGIGYTLSLEAVDPRCNLKMDVGEDGEEKYWKTASDVYGPADNKNAKNTAVLSPQNADFTQAKDIETAEDIKDVSTGKFFRNGPMRSTAELGLIHRGEPFQTLNMRVRNLNAGSSTSVIYGDGDGALWDQVIPTRLGFHELEHIYSEPVIANVPAAGNDETGLLYKDETQMVRFNINTPAIHEQAFRLLTGNLRYRDQDGNYQALSEDACNSLAKWIAYRCYEAQGGDPAASGSKCYSNYRNWGELANVFNDWAKNKAQSKAPDFTDYALEELVGATMTLTRLGEPYEYYTVLIVAQAIKDVGGDGTAIEVYRYKGDGTLKKSGSCLLGTYEANLDEITDTTYLVARLRRKLTSCKNDVSCKAGYHLNCDHKVEVLESYLVPR